jgi:hypothetical protein
MKPKVIELREKKKKVLSLMRQTPLRSMHPVHVPIAVELATGSRGRNATTFSEATDYDFYDGKACNPTLVHLHGRSARKYSAKRTAAQGLGQQRFVALEHKQHTLPHSRGSGRGAHRGVRRLQ